MGCSPADSPTGPPALGTRRVGAPRGAPEMPRGFAFIGVMSACAGTGEDLSRIVGMAAHSHPAGRHLAAQLKAVTNLRNP